MKMSEIFKSYERVRLSGKFNMIMNADEAMTAMGLDNEDFEQRQIYADLINNYSKYQNMYAD